MCTDNVGNFVFDFDFYIDMFLFDRYLPIIGEKVYIPRAYRAALDLPTGSKVILSRTSFPNKGIGGVSNEIVVTKYDIEKKSDIWKLRAVFVDRIGLVNDLVNVLTERGIGIMSLKSVSVDGGRVIEIDMSLECSEYKSIYDGDSETRISRGVTDLKGLEIIVSCDMIDDVILMDLRNSGVSIVRDHGLLRSLRGGEGGVLKVNSEIHEGGLLTMSNDFVLDIKKSFMEKYAIDVLEKEDDLNPRISAVADLENKMIRMYVSFVNCGYCHVRIKCKNQSAANRDLTAIFRNNNLNIVQMYSRYVSKSKMDIIDVMLHIDYDSDRKQNDVSLQNMVYNRVMHSGDSDMEYEVSFPSPRNYERR